MIYYRIIFTIGKQILTQQRILRSHNHLRFIRINETANFGIVVAGLQVVQAGFGIVVVPPIAEGIEVGMWVEEITCTIRKCAFNVAIILMIQFNRKFEQI